MPEVAGALVGAGLLSAPPPEPFDVDALSAPPPLFPDVPEVSDPPDVEASEPPEEAVETSDLRFAALDPWSFL